MKLPLYYLVIAFCFLVFKSDAQVMDIKWVDAPDIGFNWTTNLDQEIIRTFSFEDSIAVNNEMYYSAGEKDIVIEKLDNNGNSIWAKQISSAENNEISAMDINGNEELFLMGTFQDSVNVSLDGGAYWHYTSDTISRFIVCYREDLSVKWFTVISAADNPVHAEALIALDNGEVVFSGNYIDTISLYTAPQSYRHTNPGNHAYTIKLD